MKKTASFIVNKRVLILTVFLILTVISGILIPSVNINSDMTKYLPESSQMKIGTDIMTREFGGELSVLNVMLKGLSEDQKYDIRASLSEIPGVDSVIYDDTEKYNKDDYTLYSLNIGHFAGSAETKAVFDAVKEQYASYDVKLGGDAAGKSAMNELPKMFTAALLILMLILFLMCNSWIEPILFLATIGIAIILNMGTNLFFGSVSDITFSIAAILQLVLSMDYSIMLLNRYRQEKHKSGDKHEAMKTALRHSFAAISSSSITTIVGMLALVFMSFTIGRDLGFVLAKGVLLSLICIFTVLPAFILMADRLIEKTEKRSLPVKMDGIGSFCYKIRKVIPFVFALLFIGGFILRGGVGITYTMAAFDDINRVFSPDNPIVVLYESKDEDKLSAITEKIAANPAVESINAYATTLGKPLSYKELAGAVGMDESLIALMYYSYFERQDGTKEQKIPLMKLMQFLQTDVAGNEQFAAFVSSDSMAQLGQMGASIPPEMMAQEMSAAEFAKLSQLDETVVRQLYKLYAISQGEVPTGTIPLYDFMNFIITDIAENPLYKPYFGDDSLNMLKSSKIEMENGLSMLKGTNYSRMIINTTLPDESAETTEFIGQLESDMSTLGGDFYLIGSSVMAYEMQQSFPSEMNLITILTAVAIFIVIMLAFRSLTIPLILVLIIQCAVFITMGLASIAGTNMYYLPLLIVQCLLLGATVDYGILYTSYYRELRGTLDIKEALIAALNRSIHTILTSSLILIAITGFLGFTMMTSDPSISEILLTIAKGGITATVLVVFILPGLMSAFDRFVIKKK